MEDRDIYTAMGKIEGRLDGQDRRIDDVSRQIVQVGADIIKKLEDMKIDDKERKKEADIELLRKLSEMKSDDKERETDLADLKKAAFQIDGGWRTIKIVAVIGSTLLSGLFYAVTRMH
jgi:hypothetical protein